MCHYGIRKSKWTDIKIGMNKEESSCEITGNLCEGIFHNICSLLISLSLIITVQVHGTSIV